MRLKLNYSRTDGSHADLHIAVDADCKVGDLAERIALSDPEGPFKAGVTLTRADRTGSTTLDPWIPVVGSGIRSGTSVALAAAPSTDLATRGGTAAVLNVHSGPDAGRSFDLKFGSNTVGRGRQCAVQLSDPMVSTLHARIVVSDTVEIIDENSSNGILMGGQQVSRAVLAPEDGVLLGEDLISIKISQLVQSGPSSTSSDIQFNRSPRVDPIYEGAELVAPEPPQAPQTQRFPLMMMIMPLFMMVIMGSIMFLSQRGSDSRSGLQSFSMLIFMLMSPLMMIGGWWENKRSSRRSHEEAVNAFRTNLADLMARAAAAQDEERARRLIEHPGTSDCVGAIANLNNLLWTRRPEHASFMELRLGLGVQASRLKMDVQPARNSIPELVYELEDVTSRFSMIDRVPVVASFDISGSIGISGPGEAMLAVARGVILQLVGLHSPAEVVICGLTSVRTAAEWDWIKWLPHTSSEHSPVSGTHLASTPPSCADLVSKLDDIIDARSEGRNSTDAAPIPRVVVFVEDSAPIDRNRLVRLAEIGPSVGVHVIWVAAATSQIPAACRSFLEVDASDGSAATGRVVEADFVKPVLVEPVSVSDAINLAMTLSPVIDSGALVEDQTDLPSTVSFLADAGVDLAQSADAVLDRWRESRSVFPPSEFPDGVARPMNRRTYSLRALVGRGKGDNTYLDLRAHGPHALVGGTTGAGKSEFLQSWIMGMATAHGPQRVTFLFIDYKGGAAFADCVRLPHCVGLVTDLSPLLVRRALTSLRAELRYREHLLNRYGAKDLIELENAGNPEVPPSLIIIVDEFAALVQEVPDFVDGVVDVAQRGRSLGLHLILATQRPAGVIKENLRANTNLRIALRMADEDDSTDVIGSKVAASFDPALPGRAVAKTGPGRLIPFQTGYIGGWTRSEPPPPTILIETLGFAAPTEWEVPEHLVPKKTADEGPNDIERLTERVIEAAFAAELPVPRRPWLPELSAVYDLARLQLPRRDDALAFGVIDDPDGQAQNVVSFHPDEDGNMAVFGTGGTGKSTFLRTLAVSAGLTVRGGPCVVYGLDFGSRGLQMLEPLPHVGSIIPGDDVERVERLLKQLGQTVDERAVRYASVRAGTIGEYREATGHHDEARVILLVDGMGAFRNAYEIGSNANVLERFQSIAMDGRPVGVHVVITADRSAAVPSALASSIQRNLVLRVSSDLDLGTLGAPSDGFTRDTPAGRGFLDGDELQVAVFGGTRNVALQSQAIEKLGRRLRKEGVSEAPAIQSLADYIELGSLPALVDDQGIAANLGSHARVAIGVADDTLGPVGFDPTVPFLISGPPRSGRSTALQTVVAALRRSESSSQFILFAQRRSVLLRGGRWSRSSEGADAAAELAEQLLAEITDNPSSFAGSTIVVEGIGEFLNSPADYVLADLLKAASSADVCLVAEGETSTLNGRWPLLAPFKSAGQGFALQPDQMDGDSVFGVSFPRVSRSQFPLGRGMLVKAGTARRVQIAVS